jgi:hypothetical protein
MELIALLGAAKGVTELVKTGDELLERIQSSFLTKNDAAKQELRRRFAEIESRLKDVGSVSRVTELYFEAYENVSRLYLLSSKADAFIDANLPHLRNRNSPTYAGDWKLLEEMFDAIDRDRGKAKEVSMDVARWYSEADARSLTDKFNRFTSSYDSATSHLQTKKPVDIRPHVRTMTQELANVQVQLRNTIDTILNDLQQIGR